MSKKLVQATIPPDRREALVRITEHRGISISKQVDDYITKGLAMDRACLMSDNHVGRQRQPSWPVAPGEGRA